jgi:hypothetical protein
MEKEFKNTKCVSCDKELKPSPWGGDDVYEGSVFFNRIGYGSKFDDCIVRIVICDDCIDAKCNPTLR